MWRPPRNGGQGRQRTFPDIRAPCYFYEMKTTHHGACHCGATQFEVTADIDHVRSCNCSVCSRRGALMFRVSDEDLAILTPLDRLTCYQWGSRTAKDYFCPTCGVLPFRRPSALTASEIAAGAQPFTGWAVNVRCLEGLDWSSLPIVRIDGASLEA